MDYTDLCVLQNHFLICESCHSFQVTCGHLTPSHHLSQTVPACFKSPRVQQSSEVTADVDIIITELMNIHKHPTTDILFIRAAELLLSNTEVIFHRPDTSANVKIWLLSIGALAWGDINVLDGEVEQVEEPSHHPSGSEMSAVRERNSF